MRINSDLKENLGETPRCRRGGWAGGDGVGAVGEKLGGTRRNLEGLRGVRVFSGDVSDGSCGSGESCGSSESCGSGGNGGSGGSGESGGSCGSCGRDGITPDSLTRQLPTTPKGD